MSNVENSSPELDPRAYMFSLRDYHPFGRPIHEDDALPTWDANGRRLSRLVCGVEDIGVPAGDLIHHILGEPRPAEGSI